MMAAPRFCTVGMKSFSSQAWSLTASAAFLPLISAWKMSGYCVAEWLPQMVILARSLTVTPALAANCVEVAVGADGAERGVVRLEGDRERIGHPGVAGPEDDEEIGVRSIEHFPIRAAVVGPHGGNRCEARSGPQRVTRAHGPGPVAG